MVCVVDAQGRLARVRSSKDATLAAFRVSCEPGPPARRSLPMVATLTMSTVSRFGFASKAQLNPALLAALADSAPHCDLCGEIQKDVLANADGGEYVEAASFPGRTVQKLDAHFKGHW